MIIVSVMTNSIKRMAFAKQCKLVILNETFMLK